MPLDEDTRLFLQNINDVSTTTTKPLSIAEKRHNLSSLFQKAAPQYLNVSRKSCRHISGPNGDIPVNIFWPPEPVAVGGRKQSLPLLVFIHGGGWVFGDLQCYENLVRQICINAGVIVVNVDYRLAPEYKFPAGLEDCYRIVAWAEENSVELGTDPHRISVMGDSAGANLCTVVCALSQERRGPTISSQFLLYPLLDISQKNSFSSRKYYGQGDYFLTNEDIQWAGSQYLSPQQSPDNPLVSPLHTKDLSKLPRTFILTAEYDPLRDEGERYARKLTASGVTTEYICYKRAIHGFLSLSGQLTSGSDGLALIANKIQEYLY